MVTLSTGWVVGCVLLWLLSNAFAVAVGFNICVWLRKLDQRMKRKRWSKHIAPSHEAPRGYTALNRCTTCQTLGSEEDHMPFDGDVCTHCGSSFMSNGHVGYWNGYRWILKETRS